MKTDIIDRAIIETLKAHPDYIDVYASTITSIIQNSVTAKNFTSRNGARDSIANCSTMDFLKYALDELVNIYCALTVLHPKVLNGGNMTFYEWNNLCKSFPEANRVIELIYEIQNIQGNIFSYFKADQNKLFYLIDTIFKVRYNPEFFNVKAGLAQSFQKGEEFRQKLAQLSTSSPEYFDLHSCIDQSFAPFNQIESINFNANAVNQCVREIVSGAQVQHRHNEYAVSGSLYATQDVGRRRDNQEDSTLIMTHPRNEDFKILAVADGMGGVQAGEEVSNYIVLELSKWFSSIKPELYSDPIRTYRALNECIHQINNDIVQKYHNQRNVEAGSTLVCAIVTRYDTIIVNIGDSRAYAAKGGRLNLITEDESPVWTRLKLQANNEGRGITLKDISDLRFAPHNNQITNAIGYPDLGELQIRVVKNEDYDRLLLFSDGVHDVLSSEDIRVIANTTSPEAITATIVETAISKNAEKRNRNGQIEKIINAGKDNTTAAAYIRR